MAESWTLDGLALHDATFQIRSEGVEMAPPRQRPEWIGAADSESQALVRDPFYENRTVVIPMQIAPQASKDLAFDKVGQIRDKLAKASKYTDGIALTWTSHGSARTITFDVLAGEITELPVDFHLSVQNRPRLTITLTCKPYWRGTETLTSTTSSSTPVVTAAVVNNSGDVPALGRLIVTDTATQSRRHVEWGLEGPLTYNASTSLLLDSDSLVTSGFAGAGTTLAGTYDPNSFGNNAISAVVQTTPTAICGTGAQSHVGSFRVKARINSGPGSLTCSFRLAWRVGDGPYSYNPEASVSATSQGFYELDLGVITIPQVLSGTQRWDGRVEASANTASQTVYLDYLVLVPVTDGYGKARATYSYTQGVLVGFDAFTGTTAGSALNGRTAVSGGTWDSTWTGEGTTDFAFADDLSGEQIKRSTVSDSAPRWAILGSVNYTDTQVETLTVRTASGTPSSSITEQGVIARWVDTSNYLRATLIRTDGGTTRKLRIVQVLAGATTVLAEDIIDNSSWTVGSPYRVRLVVFASGRAFAWMLNASDAVMASAETFSSDLVTGGALDDGKPGVYDYSTATNTVARYYDDFQVATPTAEPIVLYSGRTLEIRHDDTIRQDSTGTYTGRPRSYRGSRFLVPVGTSRVLVKARRNDIDSATDSNVTDATQIQVGITPRGLAVPRA